MAEHRVHGEERHDPHPDAWLEFGRVALDRHGGQASRRQIDRRQTIRCARLDDQRQRRPAKRWNAEKAPMEGRECFSFERREFHIGKNERSGNRPFTGLGGRGENERV